MARTVIGVKNIDATTQIYKDLNDSVVAAAATVEISDTNSYDAILSSRDLHDKVMNAKAILVINGVELSSELSLAWMDRPSAIANWIVNGTVVAGASPYSATINEYIEADPTAGAIVIPFPDATKYKGKEIKVKKLTASANKVTPTAFGGQLIEGAASIDMAVQNLCYTFTSNGVGWSIT